MQLRHYQTQALQELDRYVWGSADDGLVVMPTGAGKTITFVAGLRAWIERWPEIRIVVLAHRYELLAQTEGKFLRMWPDAPIGVVSSGLRRNETNAQIVIAGIQSVHHRCRDIGPFNVAVVDEAHLVPNDSDTMYRRFLSNLKKHNPKARAFGWTATPYRLDGGRLHGKGKFFRDVIYEASVPELMDQGYLCRLRTKRPGTLLNTDQVKSRCGDFVATELHDAVDQDDLVRDAVREIVEQGRDRRSWLIFCSGVQHAHHVSQELTRHGIEAPVVVGDTPMDQRKQILESFDSGKIRAVVNCDVLTTGLNVERIDLIAVLRPTLSTGLWVQMIGRGMRPHPDKDNCLVLDFGCNAMRHGPIDDLQIREKGQRRGQAPTKVCSQCKEILPLAASRCSACGREFQKQGRAVHHGTKASSAPLLAGQQHLEPILGVSAKLHVRPDRPPSLWVTYQCLSGIKPSEWICLEHGDIAAQIARRWWRSRFGEPIPETTEEALERFDLELLLNRVEAVVVRKNGRYWNVVGAKFRQLEMALS